MKFWQVLSVFRDEKHLIESTLMELNEERYLANLRNIDDIIKEQDRVILDRVVEPKILEAIAKKSKLVFYISEIERKVFSYKANYSDIKPMPVAETIIRFNHDLVEEVYEKSETDF